MCLEFLKHLDLFAKIFQPLFFFIFCPTFPEDFNYTYIWLLLVVPQFTDAIFFLLQVIYMHISLQRVSVVIIQEFLLLSLNIYIYIYIYIYICCTSNLLFFSEIFSINLTHNVFHH